MGRGGPACAFPIGMAKATYGEVTTVTTPRDVMDSMCDYIEASACM